MISDEQIDDIVKRVYGKHHGLDKKYARERLLSDIEPILEAAKKEERKRIEELKRELADANLPRFTDEPPDDCPHGSQCMHAGGCFGKCSAALSKQ